MGLMSRAAHAVRAALFGATVAATASAPTIALPAASPFQLGPVADQSAHVKRQERKRKKRTSPQTYAKTQWLQADVEDAQRAASRGDLSKVGRLYRALSRDGMLLGLMGTRSSGLVRLPKRFTGCAAGVTYLEGAKGCRGAFARHFPNAELAKLARDGFVVGVGVGEFIETAAGLVLVRLDPEFLLYRYEEDRWYYHTQLEGYVPITPGDGRWVLYLPGGRQDPWEWGSWPSLARAYISKEHALFHRENWNSKLANPARIAVMPQGGSEAQKQSWFRAVMAWGINTVFGLTPGYDVRLLESNGRGYEGFRQTIEDSNTEFMVSVAGQVVTVTGGAGFANADIHATIRGDLIEGDGMSLAECLCEQALPYVLCGIVPEGEHCEFSWDTRPPTSRKDEADALSAAAKAIGDIIDALRDQGLPVDVRALAQRFGVPLVQAQAIAAGDGPANDIEVEVVFDDEGEIVAPGDATELTDDAIEAIVATMNELGATECRHGRPNRCPLCNIERVDTPYRATDGSIAWVPTWRQIDAVAA